MVTTKVPGNLINDLPSGIVATADIVDSAVTAAKIADINVTTAKLADASVTPAKLAQKLTAGAMQATTSGTSKDFTDIPSWVKRITIMFDVVSTNGTSNPMIQIGDSGGIENTGYAGSSRISATETNHSNGFLLSTSTAAASIFSGIATLVNLSGNTWAFQCVCGYSNAAGTAYGAGSKTLSGTLDRVRFTMANGTDAFDAGSVNILYE